MAIARKPNNRYSEEAKELDYARYIRENLSAAERMTYALQQFSPPLIIGAGIVCLAAPGLLEPSAAVAAAAAGAFYSTKQAHAWPLATPGFICKATPLHKKLFKLKKIPILGDLITVKDPKKMMGDGILYLGSDMDNGAAQVWTSMDLMVRHMLLIGTTGSGKTQAILGMLAQLMAQGSGGIFCDGKADITTWFMLYTLARHYGLERQLLVINYLTSGGGHTKRSNTTNIFEIASADSLSEMVSSMMGGGGGGGNDDMWRGRAESLFGLVIRAACEDRDFRGETIVPDDLRRRMTLQMLLDLPANMKYSQRVRDEGQLFLNDLPGYSAWQKTTQAQQKEQAVGRMSEQLGFLQMQFTRVLSLLSGTYGYITGTDISEIDWIDVINQRRTVYIMLPALEKSPESLKQLGRMVVTSMRNAMLPIIGGGQLTGLKKILIDGRPIGKQVPYALFLDEYGSYCVEGFGDVVAQIRSMGVMACFSGQDWASFKKGSEIEASRVNANTGTKIFLKTFDPDTVKLLVDICGKKLVSVASNWGDRPAGAGADMRTQYQSVESLSVQEVDRVRIDLLAKQDPGMAHVYFGGKLWTKIRMFYPDIQQSAQSQVNSFVRMRTPVGISGVVEEAERSIALRKKVDSMAKALKSYAPAHAKDGTEEKQLEDERLFCGWLETYRKLMEGRGAELWGSMQGAITEVFAEPASKMAEAENKAARRSKQMQGRGPQEARTPGAERNPLNTVASHNAQEKPGGHIHFDRSDEDFIPPPAPAVKAEEKAFSMDDDAQDLDTQTMIARTATSQTLIENVKKMSMNNAESQWNSSPQEARAISNTIVGKAMPSDPTNTYPVQPTPVRPGAASLRDDIAALKAKLGSQLENKQDSHESAGEGDR
jgi:energy-coupling factor transporter ATP-binding protein EcfA2